MFVQHIRRKARKFSTEKGGTAAIAFSVTLPVLVGFTALAADVGHVYSEEEKLRQLTETVALAALLEVRDDKFYGIGGRANNFKPELVEFAKRNMSAAAAGSAIRQEDIEFGTWDFSKRVFLSDTGATPISAARVKGYMNTARGNQLPSFFGNIFTDKFDISTETIAILPVPPDFHALSETASQAVVIENTDIDTLRAVVNSTARDALWVSGNRYTSFGTLEFHVAGGYEGSYAGKTAAARKVTTKVPGLVDFLKYQPSPVIGSCTFVDRVAKPIFNKIVVRPGTYCGGLKINVPADNVVFQPGVYVFKDGPLLIENQTNVVGDRVHFFLTGKKGGLNISNSQVHLRAQKTGKWAGMTIMSDRREKYAPERHLIQGSGVNLVGTIYTPGSKFEVIGGGLNTACKNVCVVADTMAFRSLLINSYSGYGLPHYVFPGGNDIPAPIGLAKTFRPYLIEQITIPIDQGEPGQT